MLDIQSEQKRTELEIMRWGCVCVYVGGGGGGERGRGLENSIFFRSMLSLCLHVQLVLPATRTGTNSVVHTSFLSTVMHGPSLHLFSMLIYLQNCTGMHALGFTSPGIPQRHVQRVPELDCSLADCRN